MFQWDNKSRLESDKITFPLRRGKDTKACTYWRKSMRTQWKGGLPLTGKKGVTKKPTLPEPWSWTSTLQNIEKISLYFLSHLDCGILWAAPTNKVERYWDVLSREVTDLHFKVITVSYGKLENGSRESCKGVEKW